MVIESLDAVLAGEPIDALADFLDTAGDDLVHRWIDGLGQVSDERIVDYLRRLRRTPGENVQDALLELAIAGDDEARATVQVAFDRHLYGWMDAASSDRMVLHDDPSTLPYWIDELGTICCRRNGAGVAIEALTGHDPTVPPENMLVTQRDAARAWFEPIRAYQQWSRVLGHYTTMPH